MSLKWPGEYAQDLRLELDLFVAAIAITLQILHCEMDLCLLTEANSKHISESNDSKNASSLCNLLIAQLKFYINFIVFREILCHAHPFFF